jgi:hypothetical protein
LIHAIMRMTVGSLLDWRKGKVINEN